MTGDKTDVCGDCADELRLEEDKMTDKLTPEEQEAVEALATEIGEDRYRDSWNGEYITEQDREHIRNLVRRILKLRGKCKNPDCRNGTVHIFTARENDPRYCNEGNCPDCHGTGKGEKVLLVRATDQTIHDGDMIPKGWVKVVEV